MWHSWFISFALDCVLEGTGRGCQRQLEEETLPSAGQFLVARVNSLQRGWPPLALWQWAPHLRSTSCSDRRAVVDKMCSLGSSVLLGPAGGLISLIYLYLPLAPGGCHCGFPPLLSNTLRDKVTYTDTQFCSDPHTHKHTTRRLLIYVSVHFLIFVYQLLYVLFFVAAVDSTGSDHYLIIVIDKQSDIIIDEQLFLSVSSLVFIKQTGYLFTVQAVL